MKSEFEGESSSFRVDLIEVHTQDCVAQKRVYVEFRRAFSNKLRENARINVNNPFMFHVYVSYSLDMPREERARFARAKSVYNKKAYLLQNCWSSQLKHMLSFASFSFLPFCDRGYTMRVCVCSIVSPYFVHRFGSTRMSSLNSESLCVSSHYASLLLFSGKSL